jgi:predicted NUDIX family NTP pyrophosphohydrolase
MVSITLSVPEGIRAEMKQFPEVNWSGFIRACIEAKAKQLAWKQTMLAKLKQEDNSGFTEWAVKLGKDARQDRFKELKKKGLL